MRDSDVNYVVKLDQSGTNYSNGREGGVTTDGKDVFINIANQGNQSESFSLNSRFGHEFEHARQFDDGEYGFVSDKDGNFMKDGKFAGYSVALDITDEVKAWAVHSRLANSSDRMVKGGSRDPDFQFRILDEFDKASTTAGKANVLARVAYGELNKAAPNETHLPALSGRPRGSLVKARLGTTQQIFYGRAR